MSLSRDYDEIEALILDVEEAHDMTLDGVREALGRIWDALEGAGLVTSE